MLYTTTDGIQKEIEELSFDLNTGVKQRTSDLKYKKGDRNSRILITQFYDNDMPFNLQGYNVRMYAIKPDDTKVFDECEIIDREHGTIKITLKEQMLNVAGTVRCEFVLTAADGSLMSTPVFKIIAQDSIHDTQAIESSNEFSALLNAIDTVDGLDNRMQVLKTETEQEIAKTNAQLSDVMITPDSNSMSLQRIGRKLFIGEHPNTVTYDANGKAIMMQGGCKINEELIAYILWDNLNINLNKNKLIIMNLTDGTIIKEKDLSYGWCNSIDYVNGKIYIAERGKTNSNISKNNGIIHILDYSDLAEINTVNLGINVNAISIHDNKLYVLEEDSTLIYEYDLNGNFENNTISLTPNINGLYNQNILVTNKFIYLLSSKPSNLLSVFDWKGNVVKSYNIQAYGGLYYVGEPQFIYPLANGDMVLGSSVVNFNEAINQFFKFNLNKDIALEYPIINYATTFYVDSDVEYYNPNGDTGNEFTSINECGNLNIKNYIVNGNNKHYGYTYITDNKNYIRVINSKFTLGMFAQYGAIDFNECTFNKSINNDDESCLRLRDLSSVMQSCVFNADGSKSCINSVRNNKLKFVSPVFNGYLSDAIGNAGAGNTIDFNNYDNMPFVAHSNLKKYNLFSKGLINQFKEGSYNYNTDLTATQIKKVIDSCSRVKVIYTPFNNQTKVAEFIKSSNGFYSFTETTMSTSSVNVRFAKIQMTINETGITLTSNFVTQFVNDAWKLIKTTDSGVTSDSFISIRGVEFC